MGDIALDYERLAEMVAARLAPMLRQPEFADAKRNPLGSERAFLDAGRRGDFATYRRGREVVARWSDVLAYIERRKVPRRGAARTIAASDVDPSALLDDALLTRRPRRAESDR